ncbi:MAG: hypothetical protein HY820_43740 [Acidobacteria bacterium]|nr:hypothetical protein [Acidobacteriota bacterium]
MRVIILCLFLMNMILSREACAQVRILWEDTLPVAASPDVVPPLVVADSGGNFYVAGSISLGLPPGQSSFFLVKYSPAGVRLWAQSHREDRTTLWIARAIGVGSGGAVFVAGNVTLDNGAVVWAVVKWDTNGAVAWAAAVASDNAAVHYLHAMAVDPAGNVYLAGGARLAANNWQFMAAKLSPAGVLQARVVDGVPGRVNVLKAIALDGEGHVYMTGATGSTDERLDLSADAITVKFDSSLTPLWTRSVPNEIVQFSEQWWAQAFVGSKLAFDPEGNLVVGMHVNNYNPSLSTVFLFYHALLLKYDRDGRVLWRRFDSEHGPADEMAIDASGDIFLAGSDGFRWYTRKFSPDGTLLWSNAFSRNENGNRAKALALDRDANAYVAGSCGLTAYPQTVRYCVVKYNAAGDIAYAQEYFAQSNNVATGVVVDGAGRTVTTGISGPNYYTAAMTTAPLCTPLLSSFGQAFPVSGGNGTINVGNDAGCSWTATSSATWIAIASGASGHGSGAVTYTVAPNAGGARTGTIAVQGISYTVTQAGAAACAYTLSQPGPVSASGGSGSVAVTAAAGCAWTASSDMNWLTITAGSAGSGNGTVTYSAAANPSPSERTARLTIGGQTVNVTQSGASPPPPSAGLKFVPLSPCRLVDTRAAYAGSRTDAFGPPLLAAGTTRTIPVTASATCTVPSTAKAYVFNVTLDTVENQTGPVDFLTIWPSGESRPDFWTARTTTGGYVANAAIVKAGVNGGVSVYASNNVNLILDINGYFTDEVNATSLLYYPVSPCRAVDTRGPVYSSLAPPYGNQRMQARENRTLRLPGTPNATCQIPAAAAYSVQLTLAPGDLTNGNPVAFLTAYPAGVPRPNISNMNALYGYAVANSAIIPASSNGSIDVYAYDSTNLIIDVTGYFAPEDGTGRGLLYFPLTQCRVMNTQDPSLTGPFGGPAVSNSADRSLPIPSGRCAGLPATARAWALNASVVPSGVPMPFLSMWPSGTSWPNISQLNAFQGQTVANSGIVPASSNGSIDLRVAGFTHVAIEVAGYFAR